MCGRFASYRATQDLVDAYDVDDVTPAAARLAPSWNVAPTHGVRVVLDRRDDDGARRELHVARWGLVPAWAPDRRTGSRLINARRETLDTKPAFRDSLRRRRCLVPADGYYEWERRDGRRRPFFIRAQDDGLLALAGLYAFWRDPDLPPDHPDRWVLSTTIVTAGAPESLAAIHDRVPVVLRRSAVETWLDPATTVPDALEVLDAAAPPLRHHEVSPRVNAVQVDDPSLVLPV